MGANTSQLAVIAKESGLEESKVNGLLSEFGENFQKATTALEWSKKVIVTDESQVDLMKQAREGRLKLKKIRVEVENTRKELKEQSLREGKAIDGMANIIKAMIVPAEQHLEKQENFAENLAKERKARISAERLSILLELTDVPNMYSFENMEQAVFDKLVTELKEAKATKLAAEKKAETERIAAEKAAAEEQERIRKENTKLKAEAEAREAALAEERKAAETEKLALEAKAAKEQAAIEAKLKAEREAREAVEKAEAERKAEEARKIAEAEASKQKALLAPDKEKLMAFADIIDKLELPNVANRDAGKILDETQDFLNRISKNLREKAKNL